MRPTPANTQTPAAPQTNQILFKAKALMKYTRVESTQLSVEAGDIVEVLEQVDERWWRCRLKNAEGLVPSSYFAKIPSDKERKHNNRGEKIDIALGVADVAAGALRTLPIPFGDTIFGLAQSFIQVSATARVNQAQIKVLARRVEGALPTLRRLHEVEVSSEALKAAEALKRCLEECIGQAKKFNEKNWLRRAVESSTDKDNFALLSNSLSSAMNQLDLNITIDQVAITRELQQAERQDHQYLLGKLDDIIQLVQSSITKNAAAQQEHRELLLEQAEQNKVLALQVASVPSQVVRQLTHGFKEQERVLQSYFERLAQKHPETPMPAQVPVPATFAPELELFYCDIAIDEQIDVGTYGEVYHGQWCNTDVAVKKIGKNLSQKDLALFAREIKIMAQLRHPNITQLYGACLQPEACLVMEYMPNRSLAKYLEKTGSQLLLGEKIQLALDIAKGLHYMHSRRVYHRDIKPANVLLDAHGIAKLTDFGLSKIGYEPGTLGKYATTIEWMAPEVLVPKPVFKPEADVYAFGVLLWSILTGNKPFASVAPDKLYTHITEGNQEDIPPTLAPELTKLIKACWQRTAANRPGMDEVVAILASFSPTKRFMAADSTGEKACIEGMRYEQIEPKRAAYLKYAFEAYELSAKAGYYRGQTNLGSSLLQGIGCRKDPQAALKWLLKSAQGPNKHARAQYTLGLMYEKGNGVERNLDRARSWYQQAKAQGDAKAAEKLKKLNAPQSELHLPELNAPPSPGARFMPAQAVSHAAHPWHRLPDDALESTHTPPLAQTNPLEGLRVVANQGEGHGLYQAVSLYVKQTPVELRNIVIGRLQANPDTFAHFAAHGTSMCDYVEAIQAGRLQDKALEREVLMQALDRPILVINTENAVENPDDRAHFTGEVIFVRDAGSRYEGLELDGSLSPSNIFNQLAQVRAGLTL